MNAVYLAVFIAGAVLLAVLLLIRKSRMPDSGIVVVDDISQYEELKTIRSSGIPAYSR